jgi:hypothetical protein
MFNNNTTVYENKAVDQTKPFNQTKTMSELCGAA